MKASTTTSESLRLAALATLSDVGLVDRVKVESVVRDEVARYQQLAANGLATKLVRPEEMIARLMRSLTEAGALTRFFKDPALAKEVTVYGDTVTASMTDGRQEVDSEPTCEAELTANIVRLLSDAGVSLDAENPVVVHQIWDNQVRAAVSIPPVADCLDATFRIYRLAHTRFADLVEWGSLTEPAANFLSALPLIPGFSQLISGRPGAGKTTIAQATLLAAPDTMNVRIIQEARELSAPHLRGGRWSPDGGGHTLRSLVNRALQFAPDLIVPGETRGAEAYELLKASNSGCGFMSTLHAKSARLAMESLVNAALMAGENVSERQVRRSFASLIDVVVHCGVQAAHLVAPGRFPLQQVMEICTVPSQLSDDRFVLEPVFKRRALGAPLEFCGANSLGELADELDAVLPAGVTALGLCEGTARL